jgi:hypothetical protein
MVIRGEIDVVCGGWQVDLVTDRNSTTTEEWSEWFKWVEGVCPAFEEARYLGRLDVRGEAVYEFFFRDFELATQFLLTFG